MDIRASLTKQGVLPIRDRVLEDNMTAYLTKVFGHTRDDPRADQELYDRALGFVAGWAARDAEV